MHMAETSLTGFGIITNLIDRFGESLEVERVNAGLARARESGTRLGRRPVKPAVEARIRAPHAGGMGMLKIGKTLGVGASVVQRVLAAAA
jgi:DNA invertase Pin-like site-specific DNA recombinase